MTIGEQKSEAKGDVMTHLSRAGFVTGERIIKERDRSRGVVELEADIEPGPFDVLRTGKWI